VAIEAQAAFMYNHAITLLRSEFAVPAVIPENELPSADIQFKLKAITEAAMREEGLGWGSGGVTGIGGRGSNSDITGLLCD
jgi:hypothetical protein